MNQINEHVKEAPQERPKERKSVPHPANLARTNLLALYWDKPLSSLMPDGEALPGIRGRFLPDDPDELKQNLGQYLSGGDETMGDFDSFRQILQSGNKEKVMKVIKEFKNLCPSPKELLEQNPHLLNWVPWETFIAYGDVLQGQKTDSGGAQVKEKVGTLVRGGQYVAEVKEKFPKGYPRKRTDVVLERQNKDPKTQGILEAVSNSVDAISEREKIGQFGLGVKQTFAWLEKGKGEVSALTRTDEGKVLALRARKGYDDQIYIKFSPPTPEESEQFEQNQTGTMLTISGIDIDADKQHDLAKRVEERFRYVPETEISVNDQKINGYDAIKVIGRTEPVVPQGHIDVTLENDKIVIKDSGSGMDEETLFRMFLPGHGKGYNPLSSTEAKHIAHEQAEVLLIDEERPRIVFSRNREADFAIDVPKNRLNTSSKTIVLELGRILKVSEGREGFEIDENFAAAVAILTEKTLTDKALSNDEKTTFLNSIVLGIDQLAGITDKDQTEDKTASIVRKTKSGIRKVATPYLQELKKSETTLLPNYDAYQKLATDAQYVDPYLLEGVADIPALLEDEGFQRLKSQDGITTKNGWRVLTAKFTHKDLPLLSGEGRGEVELPIILDKSHRIAILDQSLWQAMDQEQDPIKKAYLQETIQTLLNEKVLTSYEAQDPRAILVKDKEEAAQHATQSEGSLSETERNTLRFRGASLFWIKEDSLFSIDSSGILQKYDMITQTLQQTYAIPEIEGKKPLITHTTEKGTWVLCEPGKLFFITKDGNLQEELAIPSINRSGSSRLDKNSLSITDKGELVYLSDDSLYIINTFTQQESSYKDLPLNYNDRKPFLIDTSVLFMDGKKLAKFDTRDESIVISSENALSNYPIHSAFVEYKGKKYLVDAQPQINNRGLVKMLEIIDKGDQLETKPVLDFALNHVDFSDFNVVTDPSSDRIGIQLTTDIYFLKQTKNGFKLETGYKLDLDNNKNQTSQALHTLKDLFGDDPDTSYDSAMLALHSRLEADAFSPIDMQGQKETQPKRPRWDDDQVKRDIIQERIGLEAIEIEEMNRAGDWDNARVGDLYLHHQKQDFKNARTSEDLDKLLKGSDLVKQYKIRILEKELNRSNDRDLEQMRKGLTRKSEEELDTILNYLFPDTQEPAQEDSKPKRPRWDDDEIKREVIRESIDMDPSYEKNVKKTHILLDNAHTSEDLDKILDKSFGLTRAYKNKLIDNELARRRAAGNPYPDEESIQERSATEEELDLILNELFPDNQEPAQEDSKPKRPRWDDDQVKRITIQEHIGWEQMYLEQEKEEGEKTTSLENYYNQLQQELDNTHTSEGLNKILFEQQLEKQYKITLIDNELILRRNIDSPYPGEQSIRDRLGLDRSEEELDSILNELFPDNEEPAKRIKIPITFIEGTETKKENKTEKLAALLESSPLRDVFNPLWDELKEQTSVDELEELKMRFVKNAPLLVDVDGEITKETLQLFFYADNPQVFFQHNEEQQQQFARMLEGIDSLSQKETLVRTAELLTHGKKAEESELFYEQLGKVFSKERFRETFLRSITQNKMSLAQAASAPENLEITDPLRSYFLFLTNQAELIRTKEILPTQDSYEDVLPANIPLELLAHLRLTEGLYTIEEMRDRIEQQGGIEAVSQKINLFHYQDEIRKAIHAQATEAGIEKRELLQNSFDAIRKKGKGQGAVGVDFYLRTGGEEFVEEVRDNGTGIDNLVAFLVPGVTTKEGTGEQGFFGTGFYKNLEDVDSIEVDSVVKRDSQTESQRIIIDVLRDDEGSVQGGVIREIRSKPGSGLTDTGSSIRLVRKTQDRLPELEAMIAKNTYVTMGGLATIPYGNPDRPTKTPSNSPLSGGEPADSSPDKGRLGGVSVLDLAFTDEEGHENPIHIPINSRSTYDVKGIGEITFVEAPTLPPLMTSAGLRMSLLYGSEYMHDVPEPLKNLFADGRISVVLPKTLPLVKDRSRLANEENYLAEIQQSIATEAIKRAAFALLSDSHINVRGVIPEDILSNNHYYRILTSREGMQAYEIAQKISSGEVLDAHDLDYINAENDAHPLVLVLLGIEKTGEDGKKDSLLRRYQYIQEKSGNTAASTIVSRTMDIDPDGTTYSPQLAREEKRFVEQTQMGMETAQQIGALEREFNQGKRPENVQTLAETDLSQEEKAILNNYFSGIGFEEVYFVPSGELRAGGVFTETRMYLNASLLHQLPRQRLETIIHESSHLFEMRAAGLTEGAMDTEAERKDHFTHQQEGSFAQYYKTATQLMQAGLIT